LTSRVFRRTCPAKPPRGPRPRCKRTNDSSQSDGSGNCPSHSIRRSSLSRPSIHGCSLARSHRLAAISCSNRPRQKTFRCFATFLAIRAPIVQLSSIPSKGMRSRHEYSASKNANSEGISAVTFGSIDARLRFRSPCSDPQNSFLTPFLSAVVSLHLG